MKDASDRHVTRADVSWKRLPDGRVEVTRRKFGTTGSTMLKAFKVSPDLVVRLDSIGSDAWELLDGKRDLGAVHDLLKQEHPDIEDLPERLGKFVSMLVSNGLASID